MPVTEIPLNSQSFECRPRHGSLPLVRVLSEPDRLGLEACTGAALGLVGLEKEICRDCMDCGGIAVGDFACRGASRERLRERPRMRAVIAPKKDSSVGELAGARDMGDAGERGGECWPEDCDFWESTVFVRMGGGMG